MTWRALAATTVRKTFLYRNETQKSISNCSIILKRRKEPSGSVAGRGVLLHYKKRLSINQVGGDDVIKISRSNRLGVFGRDIQCH
jgi:hypothetical protein